MINVFVQVWGPISGAPNCYDWITVGKIETEKIDLIEQHASFGQRRRSGEIDFLEFGERLDTDDQE